MGGESRRGGGEKEDDLLTLGHFSSDRPCESCSAEPLSREASQDVPLGRDCRGAATAQRAHSVYTRELTQGGQILELPLSPLLIDIPQRAEDCGPHTHLNSQIVVDCSLDPGPDLIRVCFRSSADWVSSSLNGQLLQADWVFAAVDGQLLQADWVFATVDGQLLQSDWGLATIEGQLLQADWVLASAGTHLAQDRLSSG